MEHLFLTGDIQCGKSTLIQAILHRGIGKLAVAGGFLTYFSNRSDRQAKPRTLYLGDAAIYAQLFSKDRQKRFHPFCAQQMHQALYDAQTPPAIVAQFIKPGRPQIHLDGFERYGTACIQKALQQAALMAKHSNMIPLLVLDECGYLEFAASTFQQMVYQALEQPYQILGVVRESNDPSWLDGIRNHPNVTLIRVTEQNRDQLVAHLTKTLIGTTGREVLLSSP